MAILYSCTDTVEQLSGISLKGTMLTPMQHHDRRHVLPFVLSSDGQNYLLVREIESGNIAGAGPCKLPVKYFAPYYIPGRTTGAYASVADALDALAPGQPLTVDHAMPATVFNELRKRRHVEVQRATSPPVDVYRLATADVRNAFNHHRSEVTTVAQRLVEGHPYQERLFALFDREACDNFALLNTMAADVGLDGVYASWITNFQEITGLPGNLASDVSCTALYLVGSDEVWVIAPSGQSIAGATLFKSYHSAAHAMKDIAGEAKIGYESDTLFASALLDLENMELDLSDGGEVFREWREEKVYGDIAYFVLAAMASRFAIEQAASFASVAIRSGVEVTEKDIDRVYEQGIRDFASQMELPVCLRPYFVNNHAGSRTIYPSRPVNYLLSKGISSLKIDAGIFVVDDGLFHACSDIARTVTTTPEAAEVFGTMETVMLHETIPGIRPGMSGEEIHSMGVKQMGAHDHVFHKNEYMPDGFTWEGSYSRDIGHVIERQESNTFGFKPGVKRPVVSGMVGCVEFHCFHNGHAMTCEDTFVVDDQGAIIISRDPEEFQSDGKVQPRRFIGMEAL